MLYFPHMAGTYAEAIFICVARNPLPRHIAGELGQHFAQVQIAYTLMDAENRTVTNFITTYSLKHKDDRWLVYSIMGQDERDAWTAIGESLRG
jgi:hypothetical protein